MYAFYTGARGKFSKEQRLFTFLYHFLPTLFTLPSLTHVSCPSNLSCLYQCLYLDWVGL